MSETAVKTKKPTYKTEPIKPVHGKNEWLSVDSGKCELEGPYECSYCGGHVMLDARIVYQVNLRTTCPYCNRWIMGR